MRKSILAERAEDARSTVIAARARQHAQLSPGHLPTPEAGSAIGRAFLRGEISPKQLWAARRYERVTKVYQRALLARHSGSAGDLERGPSYDGSEGDDPDYVEQCNQARRDFADMRRALLDVCRDARDDMVLMALGGWILEDREMHSFLPSLRTGLNALTNLWRTEDDSAPAEPDKFEIMSRKAERAA